jgi:hypothetical protein
MEAESVSGRIPRIALMLLACLALALAGCGGAADDGDKAEGHDQLDNSDPHAGHSHGPGEGDDTGQSPGDMAALMAEMPDPATHPLEHLSWRIDLMYEREDKDGDGKLSREEYSGTTYNFKRLDADEDGFITKKEIIDDMTITYRERGQIP